MPSLPENKKLVSISQAALLLGVSVDTVRRWDKKGIIKSVRGKANKRFFTIKDLEQIKLSKPLTISEAAERLRVSQSTLMRIEEKGYIKSSRDRSGRRGYSEETIQTFLNSDFFPKTKPIPVKINLPLQAMEKLIAGNSLDGTHKEKVTNVEEAEKLLVENEKQISELSNLLLLDRKRAGIMSTFQRMFQSVLIAIVALSISTVIVIMVFFLYVPDKTADFFGYTNQSPLSALPINNLTHMSKSSAVLGTSSFNTEHNVFANVLKPFSKVSLLLVKQINKKTYKKIIPQEKIEDINDVLTLDSEGRIVPVVGIHVPDSSYIKISNDGSNKDLSDYVKEKVVIANEQGQIPVQQRNTGQVVTEQSLINPVIQPLEDGSVTSLKIADGSVTADKLAPGISVLGDGSIAGKNIKDGEISSNKIIDKTIIDADIADTAGIADSKFAQITSVNKVAGSAVQVAGGGGLTNNSGLSLLTSCNTNEILSWNGTAWVCTANIGGGSGVASVNSLNGVISIVGGGINSISTAGSSITVTGTEADTLAAVTGRGAATTTAVALNGGITSTSSTPLTLSSTNPVISIGNTGSLSVTDGNNILFSLADNGTTGNLLVTGTVNGATISGGSLTASAVNGVTTANILLNTGSYADPSWITSLAKSKVGLGNVENTALSTWAGSSNVTTTGTLTGGATGTGFTLNLGASTLSGNIGGPNIDESTLAGLTTSNFSSADISQWTNNSGYLTTVDVSSNTNLSASDGVTLTEDSISNTDKGSSQNIFKTVAVSGQSNVISDSNADTVTLVAGANVTLTTDASTDTITIDAAGSGGGSTYLAGTDLDLTGSTFSLETTLDSVDTINLAGTGTLNGLDVIDATSESTIEGAIDTLANLTSASTLATVGTLTGGATGAGFTLDFGSSTLSGNIGGSNIDESTLAGLTTSNFASANISQWTNNAGFITDGNTGWDNSYGFITASSSETLTNKTIAAGSNIITGITASNLTAGDFSSVINTGTYSIDVSGNAGTVTNGVYTTGSYVNPAWITSLAGSKVSGNISGNAATATLAANATDAVHAAYADTAGVASTSADLICTGCIGGTEIDESMLAGLTTSNFGNANISQWTNNAGYIVDGNSGWDNSYGFITASSADTLTNKAGNISQWTNDSGYLTSADISSNTNLSASDGVTLTGDALTNSDKGSSQNVFKTVAVSGQSNVVTDSNSDTLTLVAGSNVTLTTDASTDTITIDATGGGSTYSAGADLDLTGTTFSLETTIDSVDTINLAGTGTLNGLDAIDATSESTIEGAIDTLANLTTASSLTTVGTLTGGATGAGFTLNFGTSTLSGNIGGSNIDESTLAGITASNLTAGDFSSVITSGTYSIDISGNAATATTATTATTAGLATNATDAVHAAYADTATTSADLTCANCIGGDEIDESLLTLTKSQVGLSNVEDTALSTWAGSANITTTGTLTSGATGAGFTLNLGASTLSGNIGGSNIDESTLAGLTTSNFSSANISQWTNNTGFITDGNTGWDNSYGFITASGSDSLTNKTIAAGSNTITGITASNLTAGDFSSVITSGTYAIDVSGNAATATNANTVTNGIYTTGSYANPAWITSIAGSKVSGNISGNAATATLAINATDAVHANYADVAGTATTSADLTCINCIGGTEIDESALGGLTTSNFASANISQWTNNSGFITDGNTSWDNSYGFITASSSDTLTNKTIAAGSNTISDLTASNLTAGDFSSVITSGTYSIDISGNAATATSATSATNATTVTNGVYTTGSYSNPAWITALAGSKISGNISGNAATATLATNATDAVHANYADVAGTATTSADLICTNCIGGTEIDESALTLTKSQVGLGDVENTALSTWAGTSNITTTGTLTGGATGAGFTLNLGTSTLSGNVTGSNIDESTLAGLTTSNFSSANISQWTNNSGYIIDGNTGWDNSYGYITAASSDTLTNKTIAAGTNTITGITASNLTAGDYSSVITSGTYSIDISGNAATASNANTVTNGVYTTGSYSNPAWITAIAGSKITGNISGNAATATNATDSVHADYADVAGTATTSADLICTNCIGGTEIDESALTLTKSQVGLGNVENTALSTWSGTSNITTTGTLTGGATGAGFTLNFGTSTLSGDISGSNIDESTLAGLTTSNFSSANISQWTNNSGFINDGNSGWDNSYGFITASSSDTLTNKTIAAGSNTISGITASNLTAGDFSSVITSGTYAIDVSGNATTATNATTVTNGIYTTGSYANPAWITSLAGSKVSGDISGNAATASLAVNATDAVLSNVENTALSTWAGTSSITTTGTLTSGGTGAGFTLNFGTSILSGDIGGSNIDESTLSGLTASNFTAGDFSSKITSGTYSIGISGTAATASDLTCANCIGGTEIDESAFGAITGTSLNAGSGAIITSGTIGTASTTTFTGAGGTFSGALAANGGITFDNAADTLSAFTLAGTLNSNANLILNIGNAGTDFLSNGGLTLANALTVTTGGITLSAGALAVNSDSITADGATLTINAAGNVDVQDALNADSITSDAGVSIAAGQSYTGAGAVTLSSGAAAGLTLDSASGTITFSDALGIGTNNIVTGATTIASTELDRLDGKDAALVDQNDFTSADGAGGTSSGSGLEAGTGGIGLLQGCSDGQVLKWNDASSVWECGTDRGSFHNIMNGNYTNNSTTFTDVDNNSDASDKIGFPIGANEEWIFFMNVQLQTNATADQKWQVTAPAGATCDISVANVEQTVSVSNIACGTSSGTIAADTATNNIFITGSIINSSTAGNAQLQFGQTVTSGTSTIHLGSYVNAYRVDGADLAEVYYATNAADLRPGTVLAMDSSIEAGVKKSEASYDKQLVGIVTTKPGLVIGKASSVTGQPVMVALSGRVPVKVNTENGAIEPGDYLTSSSIPGVAMKATKAGAIIGQAMTGYATGGSGQVIAFIKTGFSQGASISSLVPGLSDTKSDVDRGKVTLEYFLQNKQLHGESVGLSEITTDKLTAGFEIITSKVVADELLINSIKPATGQDIALQLTSEGRFIVKDEDGNEAITFDSKGNAFFAGTVTADKIKANQIEGLEFLVSSMRNEVLSASTASAQPSASPSSVIANSATQNEALPAGRQESSSITNSNGTLNLSSLTVDGLATISANLRVKNSALIEGILNVVDTLTTNNLIVSKAADFFGNVIFHGDVAFQGRPTFNKDTAGVAFIRKGENKVEVQFAKEYDQAPVVSANIILDQITKTPDQSDEDQENMQKNIEEKLFASNVKYVITRRTTKGFVILLDKPLDEDATFSWTALNTN